MRDTVHRIILLTSLLAAGPLLAGEPEVCEPFRDGSVDESLLQSMLSAAKAGHLYRIEQETSQVGFCVESKLKRIEGNFRDFKGGMALNTGNRTDGQTLVKIRTDSLDVGNSLIRNIIKGENFFDVEHYPEVLFVSNSLEWTGRDSAVLRGDLTLRGITRPVSFAVAVTPVDEKPVGNTQKIMVKASTTIDRAEFGMTGMPELVGSEVKLCMTVQALRYSS